MTEYLTRVGQATRVSVNVMANPTVKCTVAHRGHATYIFISRDKNTVYRAIIYRAINPNYRAINRKYRAINPNYRAIN